MNTVRIAGLYFYPVKSMKGIALEHAVLTPRGLLHDRRWMVVRPNGRLVTQRDEPRLALVGTRLEDEGVVLSMDGQGQVAIPFEATGGEAVSTRVWSDDCETVDVGPEVSRWLTAALGSEEPLRIVCMAPGFTRPPNQAQRFGVDTTTLFADAAPYLVANEGSLSEVNRALQAQGHAPVPMNRFRPNIVVAGLEPFAEHRISALAGEDWRLDLADACERCLVTTVDQQTAERDPAREPYLTLRRINPVPGPRPAPAFAQHAMLGKGASIRVGAEAKVIA